MSVAELSATAKTKARGFVAERLAEYGATEASAVLPDDVLHHAKRALIDWFSVVLPGAQLPPAALLCRALADEGAAGGALLYANYAHAPLRTAALINAAAAHTIEFDDIFRDAGYHPGAPVIAAALAAAQARHADGEALLRAIVIGYEISTRIGLAVMPSHYRFWHTTATIGTFGAAAAVAAVLQLDRDRFAHALGLAGTFAAGLKQTFHSDTMAKPLHAGHAAEAGALAALAASSGVTGALDILEGAAGFGAAMSQGADWSRALAGLGERYNVTAITFKNHGCCGHIFASIDGALALEKEHALRPRDIAAVRVATYRPAVDLTSRPNAATPFDARFSTQFCVAHALVHGSVRLDAFIPERLADPAVRALMPRIAMTVDPDCDAGFPARRASRVEITTTDGRVFRHLQPTRKGDPDAPLTDRELEGKFFELVVPVIGRPTAEKLLDDINALGPDRSVAFLERG